MTITPPLTAIAEPYAILIRHAEGIHNIEHFYSTNSDHPNYKPAPLTSKGKRQASDLGNQLREKHDLSAKNVLAVYSSPLPRTLETTEAVISGFPLNNDQIQITPEIKETQLGNREGMNVHDFNEKDFWFPEDPASFGAETNQAVQERMLAAWNQAAEKFAEQSGYVLFISHGTPLYLLIEAVEGKCIRLGNAEAHIIPLKPAHRDASQ